MLLVLRSFSEGELVPSQAKKEILGHILLYHRAGNTPTILQQYSNTEPTIIQLKPPLSCLYSGIYHPGIKLVQCRNFGIKKTALLTLKSALLR